MATRHAPRLPPRWHWLGAAAICLLLAVVHTWPLATAPGALSRNDNGDAQLNEWILACIGPAAQCRPARGVRSNNAPQARRSAEALIRHGRTSHPAAQLIAALAPGTPEPERPPEDSRRRRMFPPRRPRRRGADVAQRCQPAHQIRWQLEPGH